MGSTRSHLQPGCRGFGRKSPERDHKIRICRASMAGWIWNRRDRQTLKTLTHLNTSRFSLRLDLLSDAAANLYSAYGAAQLIA